MEVSIRPRRSHSNSFGNDAEKNTAGCRALNRKYIVIGGIVTDEQKTDAGHFSLARTPDRILIAAPLFRSTDSDLDKWLAAGVISRLVLLEANC